MTKNKTDKVFDCAVILLILLTAFAVSYISGQRGSMPIVPSLSFDGGYRVFSGQIPFKDFVFAHSLAVFWLVALFFKLFGVNYTAFLVCAAFVNVVATICSIVIVRILFPQRYLSYIAGFLTAIWFNVPFSIPVPEQMSLVFIFIVITLLLFALCSKARQPLVSLAFLFMSGTFAFMTSLGKQNTGAFAFPLFFLLIIAVSIFEARLIWRRIVVFSFGFLAAATLFSSWLIYKSDFNNFLRHYIVLPFGTGSRRFGPLFEVFIKLERTCALLFIMIPVVIVALYLCNYKSVKSCWKLPFISSTLCIGAFLFQILFLYTSVYYTSYSFVGIVVSLEIGLLLHFFDIFIPEGPPASR